MTYRNHDATYVCINYRDAAAPKEKMKVTFVL